MRCDQSLFAVWSVVVLSGGNLVSLKIEDDGGKGENGMKMKKWRWTYQRLQLRDGDDDEQNKNGTLEQQ